MPDKPELQPGPNRYQRKRANTHERLLAAARVVFERDGFYDTRLADIPAEAGLSSGTFYNYYDNKDQLFRDVMERVIDDMITHANSELPTDDPVTGVRENLERYVDAYQRNARLMALLLQVVGRDEALTQHAYEIRLVFKRRLMEAIARWQHEDLVYADLDPLSTANALGCMVDRVLYEWTTLDSSYQRDQIVETLVQIWARSLGLERPTPPQH